MAYSSAFNKAFDQLIKTEGGYVNHPLDRGGPTIYGLTRGVIELYYGREVSIDEIKKLSVLKAKEIYAKLYWYDPRIHNLPDSIGAAVFDQGVNKGPVRAIKTLQKTLGLTEDGIIGPLTIGAAQMVPPAKLVRRYCHEAAREYVRIVRSNPSQIVFLEGWINRVFALLEHHSA